MDREPFSMVNRSGSTGSSMLKKPSATKLNLRYSGTSDVSSSLPVEKENTPNPVEDESFPVHSASDAAQHRSVAASPEPPRRGTFTEPDPKVDSLMRSTASSSAKTNGLKRKAADDDAAAAAKRRKVDPMASSTATLNATLPGTTARKSTYPVRKPTGTAAPAATARTATAARTAATARSVVAAPSRGAANSRGTTARTAAPAVASWDPTALNNRMHDLEQKLSQLSNHLADREAALEMVAKERMVLESNVNQRAHEVEQMASTNRELQALIDSQRARYESELSLARNRYSELEIMHNGIVLKLRVTEEEVARLQSRCAQQESEISQLRGQVAETRSALERSETSNRDKAAKIESLEATIARHESTIAYLEAKAREDELIRRKLHNSIQELKGNIRVFCRVRPLLSDEERRLQREVGGDNFIFDPRNPRTLEVVLNDPNAAAAAAAAADGMATHAAGIRRWDFSFDKVFAPASTQREVFEEISQLVQSALDGYNTCIFAYGQTGSGKTYTMEGPDHLWKSDDVDVLAMLPGNAPDESRGMIPRAVEQIFASAKALEERGWKYTMEAFFLEIYNEKIRDLLKLRTGAKKPTEPPASAAAAAKEKKKEKHEIKHDAKGNTTVTNLTVVKVTSPAQVHELMRRAMRNRAVAATKSNERSSRSHAVFQLRLQGVNAVTGETSTGLLNLIDLAGSERLSKSEATGDRRKETQNINRSLSCLGDVICALANKDSYIPYRNSKLTYLLQNSLGGNSKTLMFVNVSPLQKDLNESLSSLRFATKVNACEIGTARRQTKVDLKI